MEYTPLWKLYYKEPDRGEAEYQRRFTSPAALVYDFKVGAFPAFVLMTPQLTQLLTEIFKTDKQLGRMIAKLPGVAVKQFQQKCLVNEIKLTNEIESVHSTRKEIHDLLTQASQGKKKNRLHGLVQKYAMLLQKKQIYLQVPQDVRNIFDDLVADEIRRDDPSSLPDGLLFRTGAVEVVSSSQKVLHQGLFPEAAILESMESALGVLEHFATPSLVALSAFHYMFGYIHPFYDGNGRVVRFISSYLLTRELEPLVALGLSYNIKQDIKAYYDAFKNTNDPRNRGDLTPFVLYFLETIRKSEQYMLSALEERRDQYLYYLQRTVTLPHQSGNRTVGVLRNVLLQASLFSFQGLGVEELSTITKNSASTIRKALAEIPTDFLRITKDGKRLLYELDLEALQALPPAE